MTVRIPLDYYRILGLPIQATPEQLKQAHRDRTLQLPRREYSEIAIESRKSLIDEAYRSLADEEQRQSYDAQFLARTYTPGALDAFKSAQGEGEAAEFNPQVGEETLRSLAADNTPTPTPEPYTPTVEISNDQFVGALLILLELGEYEQAIRLGRPFMSNGSDTLVDGRYGDPARVKGDVVLSLALACLELGREQWQQNQYENAAESLDTGLTLLVQEDNFPAIQAELRSDLDKLRPYRVLELVARPLEQTAERRQGFQLLKAMLQDRGGIDGAGDDRSGLSTDDFLRFIQQLRGYLTAAEQQEIFEKEARRPSAVATYLAVYALLARGFSFHQPALVRRAKQLLQQVGTRQDVHLEQAVCALLLGQAEEAGHALERSQEYEPLAFIREHSQGAPDLLPGLCLYAERWLREEVFTHFRDLTDQQTALKDYFADAQVQSFLETMPVAPASPPSTPAPFYTSERPDLSLAANAALPQSAFAATAMSGAGAAPEATTDATLAQGLTFVDEKLATAGAAATLGTSGETDLSVAERVSQLSPDGQLQSPQSPPRSTGASSNGYRPSAQVVSPTPAPSPRSAPPNPSPPSRSPRWGRLAVVVIVGLLAMGTLGMVTVRALAWIGGLFSGPRIQQPALNISLSTPPISLPEAAPPEATIGVTDIAERTITSWLEAKRLAMGPEHNTAVLETVLVDPVLSQWQNRAAGGERDNWYYTFEHSVNVISVEPDDPTAEAITVEAEVNEVAEFFELGARNDALSYDTNLTMRYELVREGDDWYVQDMVQVGE
ncbi:IMS domain-containing protein [Halomicronema sp. CCY15110]|uniref:IMS domain-containing protein n=1 Tax=Halomicronema sp. CCY15110 TaxID=2767773 RepID=UPI001EF38BB1|nr:IMS domain-containing protein [Halomicronema sp. CCY15110]